ncbi:hypothetical protein [Sphaerochaeta pleomorpha]|nr:hypothetical protein [Sphaerochaeta pleomorpha]
MAVIAQIFLQRPLLYWIGPLFLLGILLKQIPNLGNRWITLILFLAAFLIASAWGMQNTTATETVPRIIDIFLKNGLGQGFLMAASSAWAWDTWHGFEKNQKGKKENKEK